MKTLILASVSAFALMGCATVDAPAEPEEAAAAESAEVMDCDPADDDCDHTGSVIKPPQ